MSNYHNEHAPGRQKGGVSKCSLAGTTLIGGEQVVSYSRCGACKFLRRKCISGCIFAPYFGTDEGEARFATVHKVFGAKNVSKLLLQIPENRRQDAILTVSYEAQARLSDPIHGCVSTIFDLQQQVAALKAEIVMQSQIMNNEMMMANALHSSQHHLQQMGNNPYYNHQHENMQHNLHSNQPSYSNNSFTSNNNILNMNTAYDNQFVSNIFDAYAAPSSNSLHLIQPYQPSQVNEEDDEINHN